MTHEQEVRKKVKALKSFYKDLINFAVVNSALVLIWLTFDKTGTFWPKYVMLVWGIVLVIRASRSGVTPLMFHRSSFLSTEWEEKKVREIMRKNKFHEKPKVSKEKEEK